MILLLLEIKKKIMSAVKTLLALAIMIILAMQLMGVIEEAAGHYRRWLNRSTPHGNPLKVFINPGEAEEPVLKGNDRILQKINKDYHRPVINPD